MAARVWVGFAGYCLFAGSSWLVDAAVPTPLSGMLRLGTHHVLLALIFGVWWMVGRHAVACKVLGWFVMLAGAIFLVPDAVTEAGSGSVSGTTAALVFTLVPVVVVLMVAQQSVAFGAGDDPRGLLGPAVAGVFGAALLIPFAMPVSLTGRLWLAGLVGSVVLAGLAAVWMHEILHRVPMVVAATLASGVMGVVGIVVGLRQWGAVSGLSGREWTLEVSLAVGIDGPLLLLGLWLLREMAPLGAATRYPLVLLVTIGESYLLMHGSGSWPMAAGAILMAVCAGWLLRASALRGRDLGNTSGWSGL